jgi:phosphate transport system ATP-binding protein
MNESPEMPSAPQDGLYPSERDMVLATRSLDLFYGEKQVLFDINLEIPRGRVTAIIGPSGCGKSALLRTFNRLHELDEFCRVRGEVCYEGESIFGRRQNLSLLRQQVGMVFQRAIPFPKSIYDNVAYGLRIRGERDRHRIDTEVESALRAAALWDEVRDRLGEGALRLSSGQQQRLVIARAVAVAPEVLLLDEPCSALDPVSTLKVEELIYRLRERFTLVLVTHNMQQAARVSDYTAFMHQGRMVEFSATDEMFTRPGSFLTEAYITGRFG